MTVNILDAPGVHPVHAHVAASPEAVWGVLECGWCYCGWVVGTVRVRAVDEGWPQVGTRIHHSVGTWPLLLNDDTEVRALAPGHSLELRARGWPAGEAEIRLDIEPAADGCEVTMREDAVTGPGALVPQAVRQPLITVRNKESLRRLALLAEGRVGLRTS